MTRERKAFEKWRDKNYPLWHIDPHQFRREWEAWKERAGIAFAAERTLAIVKKKLKKYREEEKEQKEQARQAMVGDR